MTLEARNQRNQRKWDNLQDSGQSHIDKILAGTSTEADLAALSNLLRQQHELAGQIFDQGVEDAVETANTIVKKIDADRVAQGKKALTDRAQDRIFQRTFKDVMSQAVDDILGQVHDEFENQSNDVRKKVEDALERIRDFRPQQPDRAPAPGEVIVTPAQRTLLDRMMRRGQRPESQEGGRRSLMDRVLNRQRDPDARRRSTVLQVIKEAAVSAKDKISSLYDRVRGSRANDGDEEKRATIWMRKLRGMFDPFKNAGSKLKNGMGGMAGLLSKIGLPLMAALMNPKLIESITDAVQKHLNFDQISKYVETIWADAKEMGSSALDTVVDKIKAFLGIGKDKPKPAPASTKPVDPLKQNTNTGVLDRKVTPSIASAELPRRQADLEAAKLRLSSAKAAYEKNPNAANKKVLDSAQQTVNLLTMRVTQFKARAAEQKTTVSAPVQSSKGSEISPPQTMPTAATGGSQEVSKEQAQKAASNAPSNEIATPSKSSTAMPDTTQQTSPVTPNMVKNASSAGPSKTEVVGDLPKYTPGKTIDPDVQVTEEMKRKAEKGSATAQIGMGSFGFDSPDSAMNILNLGMLT